jgi:SAGA-associated factor 11
MSRSLSTSKQDEAMTKVFEDLVDEVALGICFETHRAAKLGYLFGEDSADEDTEHPYAIVNQAGFDVFGESIAGSSQQAKKPVECVCPHCSRTLAAQRFAPHLEKCMGMGRNSSRIASKRIATATGKTNGQDSDDVDDNDKDSGDADWNYNSNGSKKRKKKEKSAGNGLLRKATKNKVDQTSDKSQASSSKTAVNTYLRPTCTSATAHATDETFF